MNEATVTVEVEVELVSPLRGEELPEQFDPVVVELDRLGVNHFAGCTATTGEVNVCLLLDRGPEETLAELAVRGTSALRAAMAAAGVAPELYAERCVRVAEPVPA